jgi:hypothetical protein
MNHFVLMAMIGGPICIVLGLWAGWINFHRMISSKLPKDKRIFRNLFFASLFVLLNGIFLVIYSI